MSKRCFVIGPMGDSHLQTLKWLAYDVVQPLIPDFKVQTPDSAQSGNIMTHVIQCCDRAQLVIANITGNNPNVLYEIAVLDAMGRACIPVKIVNVKADRQDKVPFDRAAYTYSTLSKAPARRTETDRIMRDAIQNVLAIRERGDMFQNPLTDYFGVPLSSFSSAHALARGYYYNLLKPVIKGIKSGNIKNSAHDPNRFPQKVFEVVLPNFIRQASRDNVEEIAQDGKLIKKVEVPSPGRPITFYEWIEQEEPIFRWLDTPTTMTGLSSTVLGRLGRHANADPNLPEYREIEDDEIDQFRRFLRHFIDREQDGDEVRAMVHIIPWAKTALPPNLTKSGG